MLRLIPLLTVLFLLTGCRDELVGVPPSGLDQPDSPSSADALAIYVKGPPTIASDGSAIYRAEFVLDDRLDHYRWSSYGEGQLTTESTDPGLDRLVLAQPDRSGWVMLEARAYDAEGVLIGYGAKRIQVAED